MKTGKGCAETRGHTYKRVAATVFRAAWADRTRLLSDLSTEFGLCRRSLLNRAKALGLPPREPLGRERAIGRNREADFKLFWRLGVGSRDLCEHFQISLRCVRTTRARLGLPMRPTGWRSTITISQILEARLSLAMARNARVEQAAMINAELVDRVSENNWVGIRQARGMM